MPKFVISNSKETPTQVYLETDSDGLIHLKASRGDIAESVALITEEGELSVFGVDDSLGFKINEGDGLVVVIR